MQNYNSTTHIHTQHI